MHVTYRGWIGRGLGALVCLLLGSAVAWGQSARIHTRVDSVGIGEPFPLYIIAETPAGSRILPPRTLQGPVSFGAVTLLELKNLTTSTIRRGGRQDSLTYQASVFGVDSVLVGPVMLGLVGPNADTTALATTSFYLPIRSVVPADAQSMYDLAPIAQFPQAWWPWVLGAIGLLLLLALLWYLYQKRRMRIGFSEEDLVPDQTPYDTAMARLAQLAETDWSNREHVKAFYVELSETLRWYLSKTLRVPALEQTTRELMRDLQRVSERTFLNMPPPLFTKTRHVLDQADLAKFADQYPTVEATQNALAQTKEAVTQYNHLYRQRIDPMLSAADRPQAPAEVPQG